MRQDELGVVVLASPPTAVSRGSPPSTPGELAQLVKFDTKQWAKVVKDFGFKPMD
jgi:hypothetical protein